MKPTLWVFWFGQFMEFLTPYFIENFEVRIYDRKWKEYDIGQVWATPTSLVGAAQCDFILLGYPAGSIEELIKEITSYIRPWATVFDICSVKTPAIKAMQELLPADCNIITIHPIFWPQSGKNGIKGLKCMVSNIRSEKGVYQDMKNFLWETLGLQIFEMTPEEHDREMAYVQGISHFIGRALKHISIPDAPLATKSYEHMRELSELVWYDSEDLFLSIQKDNPFVAETREKLMREFNQLEKNILKE